MRKRLIGSLGGKHILEQLSKEQPGKAIKTFQKENELQVPSSKPAIELLSLLGFTMKDINLSTLNFIKENTISLIKNLSVEQQLIFLEKSFPYIVIEELQEIPISIMKNLQNVPENFLRQLIPNQDICCKLPLEIQQKIWEMEPNVFLQQIELIVNEFRFDFQEQNRALVLYGTQIHPSKRRRGSRSLQKLLEIIGRSQKLYNLTLDYLRDLFIKTADLNICTFKSGVVMGIHDAQITELNRNNKSHTFTWIFDACIKDGTCRASRIDELKKFFDSITENDKILGDIAMVLADPFATFTLVRSIFISLKDLVPKQEIPKESEELRYLTILLQIASECHITIQKPKFIVPSIDNELLTIFYPMIVYRIIEEQSKLENKPSNSKDENQYSDLIKLLESRKPIARQATLYYILDKISQNFSECQILEHLLPSLCLTIHEGSLEDFAFVRSLIVLLSEKETVTNQQWVCVVDKFLVPLSTFSLQVHLQCLDLFTSSRSKPIHLILNSAKKLASLSDLFLNRERDASFTFPTLSYLLDEYRNLENILLLSKIDPFFLGQIISLLSEFINEFHN
ncbi:negative elongation factor complex member b [Anaeramoeba ignava]|uniref:Negative elongation factor complex member b n=1 Tax=Anaeramoeba ignava TaxID=1746090 RepID=A0A9Q0R6F7_ANAIG|nr:negative elongation factor complex member b [Anaeramoeba ignava]